ncbi:Asp23/Gls24 family envelope stress response protein [Nocardiopsis lucentensis]|uniref:Asp23/Gls24 family envelope stress response protein n=1 Tax=Nocardiopsis lucentensis TaxID=53441 RepID=UPI000347BFAB|nr:Asp23/Gls24 family envelope stress response protein [Nocardiopsis lucentensis]
MSGQPEALPSDRATPDAPRVAPGVRGATVVSDRAVERLVRAAAVGHPYVRPLDGRPGIRRAGGPAARADVRRSGARVAVRLRIAVAYPVPLGRTSSEVRRRVAQALERMAGLVADRIDIDVVRLVPDPRAR